MEKQGESQDAVTQAHSLDTEYFVRRGIRKGFQTMSLAAPPIYAAFVFSRYGRSHFTINRILRASYIGGGTGETYVEVLSPVRDGRL